MEQQVIRPEKSLFHYPLGLALLISAILFVLQQGWLHFATKLLYIRTKEKEHV